ncbi:MAG: hypothetical protein BJ554DRAFT_1199, partial [Olpidium bornovanus]
MPADVSEGVQLARQKRAETRRANLDAWEQRHTRGPVAAQLTSLNSGIKQNTSFITKCKAGLTAEAAPQLLNGVRTLTLVKYLSEVVPAIAEGIQKCKTSGDILAAVEVGADVARVEEDANPRCCLDCDNPAVVISGLHRRFPDTFTPPFNASLLRALVPPSRSQLAALTADQKEKEEAARIQRQRTLLRIAGELWLVGVLRSESESGSGGVANGIKDNVAGMMMGVASASPPGPTVKDIRDRKEQAALKDRGFEPAGVFYTIVADLLADERSLHVNIPLAITFLKFFGVEILGILPRKEQLKRARSADEELEEKDDSAQCLSTAANHEPLPADSVVTEEQRAAFKRVILDFFNNVCTKLVAAQKSLKQLEKRNNELYIKIGDIPEATKANFERLHKSYERFLVNAQTMSDLLDLSLPQLTAADDIWKADSIISDAGSTFNREEGGGGIWEDEEERIFYEDIIDLKGLVPPVLLQKGKKIVSETAESKKEEEGKAEDMAEDAMEDITDAEDNAAGEIGEEDVDVDEGDEEEDLNKLM